MNELTEQQKQLMKLKLNTEYKAFVSNETPFYDPIKAKAIAEKGKEIMAGIDTSLFDYFK